MKLLKDLDVFDVIVVGGGHAGLITSYFLHNNHFYHIVLERGKIGETWRSQRWDSFRLNTPGFMNQLPGEDTYDFAGDAFESADSLVSRLQHYAEKFNLPVRENMLVTAVSKNQEEKYFRVTVISDSREQQLISKHVVIAAGIMNVPKTPSIATLLSKNIFQLHVSAYRSAAELAAGAVLIVGGGQSGCQVAEDLIDNGREVYLSTGKVARMPRRYKGKDIMYWLLRMKYYEVLTASVSDIRRLKEPTPLLSGVGALGHSLSLQLLREKGVTLLGHLNEIDNDLLYFDGSIPEIIRYADDFAAMIKSEIDNYISCNDSEEGLGEDFETGLELDKYPQSTPVLNCVDKEIKTVVWATGFTGNYDWIQLPVFRQDGSLQHTNGITPVSGLYVIGLPWLRTRKSGIIYGSGDDASYIVRHMLMHPIE